ncbi:MAG: glycosyltransferase [Proteobacteria bacterium]|jgi:glycosyltransferase involved in cell wall biosynthesis|nr:glycosyltransferase [Desulfocapsa sp.]MBU3944446.1 glycosyltransferase [Pseudomonadota bacterium]MBU4042223.1 glycosyltransferase [Pseudomonadota bacterium]MBU4107802.1 glycosyltransferase [Pseudomonadota bacterium]MBU4167524.1 glycosyltransferase [Pseudomonadota bacterium]
MKQDRLISVIVPNFNNSLYLEECLLSVIRQTYKNIEIIVVDDVSTDHSAEIITDYSVKDHRIMPVFNVCNVGVAQNRHNAIMMSKGEFITTLDSDDIFFREDKLEKELACLLERKTSNGDSLIVFSGIVLIDSDGAIIGKQHANIQEGMLLNAIFSRTCMVPRDFLFTKEQYLKAGGFDNRIAIYEDWDLKIRLASENKFFYSGIDGIGYRRHGKGLSAISPLRHILWLHHIFVKNIGLLQSKRIKTVILFYNFLWKLFINHFRKRYQKYVESMSKI